MVSALIEVKCWGKGVEAVAYKIPIRLGVEYSYVKSKFEFAISINRFRRTPSETQ